MHLQSQYIVHKIQATSIHSVTSHKQGPHNTSQTVHTTKNQSHHPDSETTLPMEESEQQ